MLALKGLFVRVMLVAAVSSAVQTTARSQTAAGAADKSWLPAKYQTFSDPQGSAMALSGRLAGKASSAKAVLLAILQKQQAQHTGAAESPTVSSGAQQFDSSPLVRTLLADDSDKRAQAVFNATIKEVSVVGVVSVNLSESGGTVSIVYDRPASFEDSFSHLQQTVARAAALQYGNAQGIAQQLPDGSTISVPEGWVVTHVGRGSVDLSGPNAELMSLGAYAPVYSYPQPATFVAPCCDPVRAYQLIFPQLSALAERTGGMTEQLVAILQTQPAAAPPNAQGAYVLSEIELGGRSYVAYSYVVAAASYSDPWAFYLSSAAAPKELFESAINGMIDIWKSYRPNSGGVVDSAGQSAQTPQTLNVSANPEMIKKVTADNAAAAQAVARRWEQVLRNANPSQAGAPLTVDTSSVQKLADALTAQSGGHWHVVPVSGAAGKP